MADSCKLLTIRAMDKIVNDAVTSEATDHEIEKALDHNLDRFWKPTSTANQTASFDLGRFGELISAVGDRDFSAATNWSNNTCVTFDKVTDLTITASAISQYCTLAGAAFGNFEAGKTYRLTYDYTERTAGWKFQTGGANEIFGTAIAGTNKTFDLTCTVDSTSLIIVSTTDTADGDFDNISIAEVDSDGIQEIDGFGIWVHNYGVDFNNAGAATLTFDHFYDSGLARGAQFGQFDFNDWSSPQKLYLEIQVSSSSQRYWRMSLTSMSEIIEISQIFLFKEYEISIGNAYPEEEIPRFGNKVITSPSGRSYTRRFNRLQFQSFARHWDYLNETDFTALQAAVEWSHEACWPLILNEGTDYWVVKIRKDSFRWKRIQHQQYQASIIFDEVPYADPEENY